MSLRAFAKGFATTAAPSFLRGFEQQGQRIETRRQEGRQDQIRKEGQDREDTIRQQGFDREDRERLVEDGKASMLAAANTGDPKQVDKAFSALSPDVQSRIRMILPRYLSKAKKAKITIEREGERHEAQTAASKAQTDASKGSLALSQFQLEEARGDADAESQINNGAITDEKGLAGATKAYYDLFSNGGASPTNLPLLSRYVSMIDKYNGNSELATSLRQHKIEYGDEATLNRVLNDLPNHTPQMIRQIAFGMGGGKNQAQLRRIADGIEASELSNSANNIHEMAFDQARAAGKTLEEASKFALDEKNKYKTNETMLNKRRQLSNIAQNILGDSLGETNIETLIDRVKRAVKNYPNLVPRGSDWEWLKGAIMKERGLDQAARSGPGGPVAGEVSAEGAPPSTGTSLSEPSETVESMMPNVKRGSIWDRHITQRNFSNMSPEYDKARNPYAPVDATQGR